MLAHWGMLVHLPELLGIDLSESFTLTSLRFRAKKALAVPDGRVFHSCEAAAAVLELCAVLREAPEVDLIPQLQDIQGIDAGEAVLLSAVAEDANLRLLTGDKRALRALSSAPEDVRRALAGRVVVVEQVIQAALHCYELDWLRAHVCPYREIDKAIAIVMGSRCDAEEEVVREALAAYIAEIRGLCDPSLLSMFER